MATIYKHNCGMYIPLCFGLRSKYDVDGHYFIFRCESLRLRLVGRGQYDVIQYDVVATLPHTAVVYCMQPFY